MTGQPVNVDTFVRAETARMIDGILAQSGGVNACIHMRGPAPLDRQTVIRMNRDTQPNETTPTPKARPAEQTCSTGSSNKPPSRTPHDQLDTDHPHNAATRAFLGSPVLTWLLV